MTDHWHPCPFCGADLWPEDAGMEHPQSDTCPLDSLYIETRQREAWNPRDLSKDTTPRLQSPDRGDR